MKELLAKLVKAQHLTTTEIEQLMQHCFSGDANTSEISAFLTAMHMKGETAEEIASIAHTIREQSTIQQVMIPNVFDNCGTGGDRSYSFNISTTVAFVLAGAGVTVAKHGNRSVSSKTGSADVLEYLGVSLHQSTEETIMMLKENHISFLYAPHVHRNLRPFTEVRKELGLPTVFNLIGPLTNPIALDSQLVGVYDRSKIVLVAKALQQLGRKRAIVLHGAGGMDEASLAGENDLILLENGQLTHLTISPADVGLPSYPNEAIRGGDTAQNAEILLAVLNNEQGAYLDTVLFNAAIAFYANGKTPSIEAGIDLAKQSIASGAAMERLQTLIQYNLNKQGELAQ